MSVLEFRLDKTGFPMLWVDVIDAYIHWMPITKIQFEYFICAAVDSHFDAAWYDEILALNPRVTPRSITGRNYWQAFLTGIYPSEGQRYAAWSGEGYAIPTLDEWFSAYSYLKALQPQPGALSHLQFKERISTLLDQVDKASKSALGELGYQRTLADQMLMRMGVKEWIEGRNQRFAWGGMGETYPRFHGDMVIPELGQPSLPNNPEDHRLYYYGFRLIWRPL